MFTPTDLRDRIKALPFAPVRIITSTGQSFDVYHPDLVMVGKRFLEIGLPSAEDPRLFEAVTRVAILHLTALEDLPARTSPDGGNGAAR
jgi:hypothetical protein